MNVVAIAALSRAAWRPGWPQLLVWPCSRAGDLDRIAGDHGRCGACCLGCWGSGGCGQRGHYRTRWWWRLYRCLRVRLQLPPEIRSDDDHGQQCAYDNGEHERPRGFRRLLGIEQDLGRCRRCTAGWRGATLWRDGGKGRRLVSRLRCSLAEEFLVQQFQPVGQRRKRAARACRRGSIDARRQTWIFCLRGGQLPLPLCFFSPFQGVHEQTHCVLLRAVFGAGGDRSFLKKSWSGRRSRCER